ncbi:TetR family transcriptional regulator [Agromyces soli]|uniref:TetR/AcrR family transcriptional regulator n=1 Tax=Agromyces soli TaxID=659012 RepID=A0ABY4AVA5_9MICO|nr:TetR family transcriptional regulator [Agromyces soli]UOE27073.1 TetR/AcrR family transcriptional regulator [Agromyces soli]
MSEHAAHSEAQSVGLRERRRQTTRRELAAAALELFERQGLHGTTTDDIARLAGISPRTFFRYAETKEHAMFLGDDGFEDFLAQVATGIRGGARPVDAIEAAQIAVLRGFDAESSDRQHEMLRVRRLIISEPSLLSLALAADAAKGESLLEVLTTEAPDIGELEARALVAALTATMRLAFDEWVRRAEAGETASVHALHEHIQRSLVGHFSERASG